ncbi:MAG: hypothetical protein ACRDKI_09655 [Solirubrobacterales bacterium]
MDPDTDKDLGFPVEGDAESDQPLLEEERELTAMEMMGAPNRPSDNARKTVLWISLAFASVLFAMTVAVISYSGIDVLTLSALILLGVAVYTLIGAVRYKGEDPMAQFDPPPRPKKKRFRKR